VPLHRGSAAGEEEESAAAAEAALKTLETSAHYAGGAEVAGWLRTLRTSHALPPTTALVEVRSAPPAPAATAAAAAAAGALAWRTLVGGEWGDVGRKQGGGFLWSHDSASEDASSTTSSSTNYDGEGDEDDSTKSGGDGDGDGGGRGGGEGGNLLAVIVLHVSNDVPREALGPTAGTRDGAGWRGDIASWFARCPERLSVALVEVPVSGASGVFPHDAAGPSASTAAVAAAAAFLPRQLGLDAVVFPLAAGTPMPFLKSALAQKGAHHLPAPGPPTHILHLAPGGILSPVLPAAGAGGSGCTVGGLGGANQDVAWDGYASGYSKKARHEYRRGARRFAEVGGTVELVMLREEEEDDDEDDEDDDKDKDGGDRVASRGGEEEEEWMKGMRWPTARRLVNSADGGDSDSLVARSEDVIVEGQKDGSVVVEGQNKKDGNVAAETSNKDAAARESSQQRALLLGLGGTGAGGAVGMTAATRAATRWTGDHGGDGGKVAGGWRMLEARVNGERAGMLLLLSRLYKRHDTGDDGGRGYRRRVTNDSASTPHSRRVVLHACWLHPTLAKPHGVLAALLRGAISFAAVHGCASVDLGPGGDALKLRVGAMAVQPTLMCMYGDWRLRAPSTVAGASDKTLYQDLLDCAKGGGGSRGGAARRSSAAGRYMLTPLDP
jgi:hypothetical protein